ncbi:MAG: efflux RND transporter periplasmic adaptor subunit [Opitutaceae bacterium]|jgi:membrane fusion protein (multidrug efflux system)|nr:efflux RND transporter periplasmic adaptor subunit [Opitutaceae bacterium]
MTLPDHFVLTKKTLLCLAAASALILAGCDAGAENKAGKSGKKGGSGGGGGDTRPQPVEVVNIERRDLIETLNLVGSLAPNETAQIRAEIAGQVREVLFDEGQQVKQGQLLMRVDDSELRAQLAQADAKLALATQNLKRIQSLTSQQFISEAEADQTLSNYDAAVAEAEYLRVRLAKMEIKAPFDGIAGARTVSPGDYVTATVTATPITTIDDLSRLKIEFQVPERFVARVKPGTRFKVRARTPDGEAETTGEVYFASVIIDRATRSVQVKGYVDDAPAWFRPGMFANVELELATRAGVLTVPEGAILITTEGGAQIVIARERDGGYFADFMPIEMGMRERGLVEITPRKKIAPTTAATATDDAATAIAAAPGAAAATLEAGLKVVASGVGALILYQDGKLEPRALRKEFALGGTETDAEGVRK